MGPQIDRDAVVTRLKTLLVEEVGMSESSLTREDLILVGEDTGIDSVAVLRLVMAIEKVFDIVIGDSDISPENFQTLGCLVELIERKRV
jgi:acyl carrier protein